MLNYVQADSNSHCVYDFDTDSIRTRSAPRLLPPRIPEDLCRTGYTSREEKVSTKTGIIMLAVYVTRLPASSIPYLNLNTPACRRSASPSLGNARALLQHGISLVAPTSSRMLHRFIFHSNIFVLVRTRTRVARIFCQMKWHPCLVPASRRLETLSESFPIILRGASISNSRETQ